MAMPHVSLSRCLTGEAYLVRGTIGLDWRDFERFYQFDRNKKRGEKMRRKKREPATRKPADSQPKVTATKGQLDSKIHEVKSQESLLLFLFVANYSEILTEPMIELIWDFMEFLKSQDYYIINGKEVFCFPASKLIRFSSLK